MMVNIIAITHNELLTSAQVRVGIFRILIVELVIFRMHKI